MMTKTKPGEIVVDELNRIIDAFNALEQRVNSQGVPVVKPQAYSGTNLDLYRVISSAPVDGHVGRWLYTVEQVTLSGDTYTVLSLPSATYPAYNVVEAQLSPIHGNGVDITRLATDYPAMAVMPAPAGVVVFGRRHLSIGVSGTGVIFQYENAIDGEC